MHEDARPAAVPGRQGGPEKSVAASHRKQDTCTTPLEPKAKNKKPSRYQGTADPLCDAGPRDSSAASLLLKTTQSLTAQLCHVLILPFTCPLRITPADSAPVKNAASPHWPEVAPSQSPWGACHPRMVAPGWGGGLLTQWGWGGPEKLHLSHTPRRPDAAGGGGRRSWAWEQPSPGETGGGLAPSR